VSKRRKVGKKYLPGLIKIYLCSEKSHEKKSTIQDSMLNLVLYERSPVIYNIRIGIFTELTETITTIQRSNHRYIFTVIICNAVFHIPSLCYENLLYLNQCFYFVVLKWLSQKYNCYPFSY